MSTDQATGPAAEDTADGLIAAIRRGREALDRLFRLVQPQLRVHAENLTQNGPVRPSDLVQNTLLRAFERFHTFRGSTGAEFEGWLRQIMRNVFIDEQRHRATSGGGGGGGSQTPNLAEDEIADQPAEASSPAADSQLVQRVWQAIDRLPDNQRLAILLRRIHGLGEEDIVRLLRCPSPEALRQLRAAGMRAVREELGGGAAE